MSRPDILDHALGVQPGDRLDAVREARPGTKANAQLSYEAVFEPTHPTNLSVAERFGLAVVATRFHGENLLSAHYEAAFAGSETRPAVIDALREVALAGTTSGPYGVYRETGLSGQSVEGPRFRVPHAAREVLGDELAALFEYVHLLVFRPREANADALQVLLDEGWSVDDVVTVSQLVAFLTFQIRLAAGLSVLRASWDVHA
ncbi:CMD domain protein [Microbacterium allomyrinae]|uniref:CMD domain protein n=1 Tax=Microbacterium allomyrinae TaxID=2830666 RepID=A0A9X1LTL0_9MICO|nr:CMD domain protein [Microbacterium allomyrinae]MCC2031562.1 CMD domain protein [Microbacterium allomyrinae]